MSITPLHDHERKPNTRSFNFDLKTKQKNFKLIDLIDHYMSDLDKVNKLDADTYKQLLGIIPKEDRESFDNPTNILISLLKKG